MKLGIVETLPEIKDERRHKLSEASAYVLAAIAAGQIAYVECTDKTEAKRTVNSVSQILKRYGWGVRTRVDPATMRVYFVPKETGEA